MHSVQAPQQSFLGIAVDVEYLPLDDAATAAPLLQVRVAERVVCAACLWVLGALRWAHQGCSARAHGWCHIVRYNATTRVQDLADVLGEAVAAAGGRLRQVPSSTAAFQLPATCGPRHRAAQYVQLQQLFGESTAG